MYTRWVVAVRCHGGMGAQKTDPPLPFRLRGSRLLCALHHTSPFTFSRAPSSSPFLRLLCSSQENAGGLGDSGRGKRRNRRVLHQPEKGQCCRWVLLYRTSWCRFPRADRRSPRSDILILDGNDVKRMSVYDISLVHVESERFIGYCWTHVQVIVGGQKQ